MAKWVRVLVGFGVLLVACATYIWFFGVQTYSVWEIHRAARENPAYRIRPVPLANLSLSQTAGTKLAYLGYEFEVPWDDIDREKTRVPLQDKVAVIMFRSGKGILFWRHPPNEFVDAMLLDPASNRNTIVQVLGEDTIRSDYNLERAALDVTPDSLSIFDSRRESVRKGTLFLMKGPALLPESASGIFLFDTPEFKGIQYGVPQNSQKHFGMELFSDDAKFMITFVNPASGTGSISQEEANRVVQSLHKVGNQISGVR